jgi:site-specific recombinase XerD
MTWAPDTWRSRLDSLEGAYSENTIRSYRSDFIQFEAWCTDAGTLPLPASGDLVAQYVTDLSVSHAPASIRRSVAAISRVHQFFDYADPGKSEVVRMAVRRLLRARSQRQKQVAGLRHDLRDRLMNATGAGLVGQRDRALISVGYDTLCRRSELVALRAEDIVKNGDGSGAVLVRRSKADQLGQGRLAYLSHRSIRVLQDWLASAAITEGHVFRAVRGTALSATPMNASVVPRIIKRLAVKAGLATETVARLSGHSFRVGAALDMTEHGIDLVPIMHAGGWKSPDMVVRYTAQISLARSGMALLSNRRPELNPASARGPGPRDR